MARSRTQRRRDVLLWVLAALTLLVLVFAREVSRAGHASPSAVASVNASFAAQADSVIGQINGLEADTVYLLTHGDRLSRVVFWARLQGLSARERALETLVETLRTPDVSNGLNLRLVSVAHERLGALSSVLTDVARRLSLPWSGTSSDPTPLVTLENTTSSWKRDHRAWHGEPGASVLPGLSGTLVTSVRGGAVTKLTSSPTLALRRAVGLTAVAIRPSPLPAPTGVLSLAPVSRVHVGVTVTNFAVVRQSVTVRVTLRTRSAGASPLEWSRDVVIGALRSVALTPPLLHTAARERATLTISVVGAPAAPGWSLSRTYRVVLGESGA